MKIEIRSQDAIYRDFAEAFEAARRKLPYGPTSGVYFTSLEAARRFLTPQRLRLIRAVRTRRPDSIYALAKIVGRRFSSVRRDVDLLSRHGLLRLSRVPSARRAVRPSVRYDAISLWVGL